MLPCTGFGGGQEQGEGQECSFNHNSFSTGSHWVNGFPLGLAMRMRNMRMMRIMRICGCVCGLKISSTLSTYECLPKMATFWARNGSAWLCFQFWVPKISLLFIPPGFIHPQEWKLRVQNHKILVKKRWFFFTIDAVYAHWCASDAHRCASAKIGAWPALVLLHIMLNTALHCFI